MQTKQTTNRLVVECIAAGLLTAVGCAGETAMASNHSSPEIESAVRALLEQHPDAYQYDDHSIAWDDGETVMSLLAPKPQSETDADGTGVQKQALTGPHGCPDQRYCLYEDGLFNTTGDHPFPRMLQFRECFNDLNRYGFQNQLSSWVNNTSRHIVAHDANREVLFVMGSFGEQGVLSWFENDTVDYVDCK